MTLEFYKAEEARLLKILSEKDPSEKEYNTILNNLENLALHVFRTQDAEERLRYAEENDAIDNGDGYFATQSGNVLKLTPAVKPETPAEEHPVEQPFPEPEQTAEPKQEPATEPVPTPVVADEPKPITYDEVKTEFINAAREGIKVAEIIADTGYSKLSDVPADLYAALLRTLYRRKAGIEE